MDEIAVALRGAGPTREFCSVVEYIFQAACGIDLTPAGADSPGPRAAAGLVAGLACYGQPSFCLALAAETGTADAVAASMRPDLVDPGAENTPARLGELVELVAAHRRHDALGPARARPVVFAVPVLEQFFLLNPGVLDQAFDSPYGPIWFRVVPAAV
jgi:hypothetical protein